MRWERTAGASSSAPAERVWEVVLDGRRWSFWNEGVEWMTIEGALAPGTFVTIKPKGGRQTAFRIEAVVPARLLALVVTFGPLAALRFRLTLSPHDEGTSIGVTTAIDGPLSGLLLSRSAERIAATMPANLQQLALRAASLEIAPA